MRGSVFVSLVCVCDGDPDRELALMSAALHRAFPLHEIVVSVREPSPPPTLANVHVLELAPPADDRVRLAAGLDHALGDVIVLADPARDDPHAVVQAAALVASGSPAVYEVRGGRHGPRRWVHNVTRKAFSQVAGLDVPEVAGVRACNREVLSNVLGNPDRDRLLEAFPAVTGHPWEGMPGAPAATPAPRRPLRWHASALLAASARPLRLAYGAALLGAALNLAYSAYVVVINIVRGHTVEGWTSLSLQLAGMFFLISVILAGLAEYIFQVVKRGRERPLYRIRSDAVSPALPARDRLNVEHTPGDAH